MSRPPSASTRSASPRRPEPPLGSARRRRRRRPRAAGTVGRLHAHAHDGRAGVLGECQCLGDDVVGGGLDRAREPVLGRTRGRPVPGRGRRARATRARGHARSGPLGGCRGPARAAPATHARVLRRRGCRSPSSGWRRAARRSMSASDTSRCCAPSCRLRSSRRAPRRLAGAQPARRRAAAARVAGAHAAPGPQRRRHPDDVRRWPGAVRRTLRMRCKELREAGPRHPPSGPDRAWPRARRCAALADRAPVPVDLEFTPRGPAPGPGRGRRLLRRLRGTGPTSPSTLGASVRARARGPVRRVPLLPSRSPTTARAAPTRAGGSGLRGLADRVEALGGRLTVNSPLGEGTTLRAEPPNLKGTVPFLRHLSLNGDSPSLSSKLSQKEDSPLLGFAGSHCFRR